MTEYRFSIPVLFFIFIQPFIESGLKFCQLLKSSNQPNSGDECRSFHNVNILNTAETNCPESLTTLMLSKIIARLKNSLKQKLIISENLTEL